MDTNYVYNYLFENRFTPFNDKMTEFNSLKDYIFGKGIGSYLHPCLKADSLDMTISIVQQLIIYTLHFLLNMVFSLF